tara:strand:- start:1035 stop:1541 length:507 start_codon:yes stop_codon:yes gene_type:complete
MSWDEKKIQILKNEYGKGKTASQIAEIIGGVSRNAVIGKCFRLGLSGKLKVKSKEHNSTINYQNSNNKISRNSKKSKFRSLVLDKNFEEAKNLSLEELADDNCKFMEGDPSSKDSKFCGRKVVEKRSYCPLHMMMVFQFRENSKIKKDEATLKDEDVPAFLEKKVKSA